MRRLRLLLLPPLAAGGLLVAVHTSPELAPGPIPNRALRHALDVETGRARRASYQQPLSAGVLYALLEASGELDRRVARVARSPGALTLAPLAITPSSRRRTQGCQHVFRGRGRNVRVNQDCSLRRQSEEVIAVHPGDARRMIVGMNDSRTGLPRCVYAWSFDRGKTWGDQLAPFYGFTLGDGQTADVCADPTVTFDLHGNAYVGGILFNVNSTPSAVAVVKSNAGIDGAFYHAPDATLPFQTFSIDPVGIVVSENVTNIFHDKAFIVADANSESPRRDALYATWTRNDFATGQGVGSNSPIYFSQSLDGGAQWSVPIEVSGRNAAICTDFSGSAVPDACDQSQGSHPIVAPDGTLYVAFANNNRPSPGVNQSLLVSCAPSVDCSVAASWTSPVRIAELIGTHPEGPDPDTGCFAGARCLPPNGYRVPEVTSGSLSVDVQGRLYFVWADFRNGGPPCTPLAPATAAAPPCDNDVFYAFSEDGGATWSAARNVTPAAVLGASAQWQPWSAVTTDGETLWVVFYDRSYGSCELEGCNDITLARVEEPASGTFEVKYRRLTTASMPNLLPVNNPRQAGFLGDYMWVAVDPKGRPLVVWSDTRGAGGAVEADVYFARGPRP